ncbi:unnamed protein product [Prunus brigantina]
MEGEMSNFFKVWLSVYICLCYCYATAKLLPKGCRRLLCLLPIVCLFLYLPLFLSSIHLVGVTSFFISWLANFKLFLLAFGKGPLSSDPPISLGRFVAVACLPIKIQQNNPPPNSLGKHKNTQNDSIPSLTNQNNQFKENSSPAKSHKNTQNENSQQQHKENPPANHQNGPQKSHIDGQFKQNPHPSPPKSHINGQNKVNPIPQKPKRGHRVPLNYVTKGLLFGILLRAYDYSDQIHPKALLLLYSLHMYLLLELILAVVATLARALLAIELEPQFNEPYLSTSLQDFWGRRWNLMVTSILRPTVYEPTLDISRRVVDRKWAPLPAVLATFVVSALMHEIVFYHMGRMRPTWGVTCFFLLHGICLTVEIALKKVWSAGRWRLPRLVSGLLTVGFVMGTCFWLFLPQFFRFGAHVKAFEEYAALGELFRDLISPFVSRVG